MNPLVYADLKAAAAAHKADCDARARKLASRPGLTEAEALRWKGAQTGRVLWIVEADGVFLETDGTYADALLTLNECDAADIALWRIDACHAVNVIVAARNAAFALLDDDAIPKAPEWLRSHPDFETAMRRIERNDFDDECDQRYADWVSDQLWRAAE